MIHTRHSGQKFWVPIHMILTRLDLTHQFYEFFLLNEKMPICGQMHIITIVSSSYPNLLQFAFSFDFWDVISRFYFIFWIKRIYQIDERQICPSQIRTFWVGVQNVLFRIRLVKYWYYSPRKKSTQCLCLPNTNPFVHQKLLRVWKQTIYHWKAK